MKGYKGFNKDFTCRGKQYKENTVFEEEKAVICHSGLHFCENPFDVLDYYGFANENGETNEFAAVEAMEKPKTNDGKKYCTKKLKIGAKLGLSGFIKACVDFVMKKTTFEQPEINVWDDEQNEDSAQIGSSGNYAQIGSSGYSAQIGSSGNYAKIDSSGEDSIIMSAGAGSIVKAKKGSWITLAEWEYSSEKERYVPVCVKTEYVDGKKIKEDVFYQLKNGNFVELKP